MLDFMLFLPLIIVGAGAISLMLLSAYEKVTNRSAATLSMGIFGFAFLVQLIAGTTQDLSLFTNTFNGMLVVNPFTKVAGLIILGCGLFTAMMSSSYFEERGVNSVEYYCLTVFAASGMLLLTMAAEMITAFIALEIMSLAIYVLVATDRRSITATEAVLKYLMLGAFAGAFFTMGAALIYGGAGSTKFALIGAYIHEAGFLANGAMLAGSFLVIVALLFKVAAFPFHAWVVDVYDGATLPVTGFMATALKTAVFVMFANFLNIDGLQEGWVCFLFWAAVLTMFAGNLIAMAQENLKRMLAASGIVHSGYLIIGLVALNDSALSVNIIIYYLAAYAIGTIGMFAALTYLAGGHEKRIHYDDFKGLAKVRPYSAAAITIFLLSMAGIPPTAGFMGKFYIITGALNNGQMALAVLGVISSVLSMWYYLRLVINMYFHEAQDQFETDGSSMTSICCMGLAAGIFIFSFIPIAI